jgi:anaerobic carbon-monoxide dehydrogenase iron sulfur subunit
MVKALIIDLDKCTGCRTCEVICSLTHEKESNTHLSRVRVIKWDALGIDVPIICHQCKRPNCRRVCPTKSIKRNTETGGMEVNTQTCVGCELCAFACPFGAPAMVQRGGKQKSAICDLCGGDPKCAQYCETGAIQFIEMDADGKNRRLNGVKKTLFHLKKRIDNMEQSKVLSKII